MLSLALSCASSRSEWLRQSENFLCKTNEGSTFHRKGDKMISEIPLLFKVVTLVLAQYLLLAVKGVIFILKQNPVQLPSLSQALDTNQAGSNFFSRENEENHRKLLKQHIPLLSSMIFVIEYQESLESKIGLLLAWSLMFLNQMLGSSKMSVGVHTKSSISSS